MPVIINEHLVNWKQIRFPKSKKKRIRKKWEKQRKNWLAIPEPDVFIDKVKQVVYAHPITAEKLRHQLDKQYKPFYSTDSYRRDFPFKWEAIV